MQIHNKIPFVSSSVPSRASPFSAGRTGRRPPNPRRPNPRLKRLPPPPPRTARVSLRSVEASFSLSLVRSWSAAERRANCLGRRRPPRPPYLGLGLSSAPPDFSPPSTTPFTCTTSNHSCSELLKQKNKGSKNSDQRLHHRRQTFHLENLM